jgi:hypothetical protein
MDPITQQTVLAAAGAGEEKVYVDDVFSTYLYEGTGSTQTITNGIDLAGEGGLIWTKWRSGGAYSSQSHALLDTERGLTQLLRSDTTAASQNVGLYFTANSDGYEITAPSALINHSSGGKYASWTFRKAPGFFDVVTYTGDGVNLRQVAHSLASAPGTIIVKCTNTTSDWWVWHRGDGTTPRYLRLNTTAADNGSWNMQPVAGSEDAVFEIRGGTSNPNVLGNTYVAYIFAHDDAQFGTDEDESIIKCGSYTHSSSTGNEIDLGFEPQWLLYKSATSGIGWYVWDTMRGWSVNSLSTLQPNTASAESTINDESAGFPQITNTGFKVGTNNYTGDNQTYIYMAIRRPHKPPTAATEVFAIDTSDATSPSPPQFTSGFVTDFIIRKLFNGANNQFGSRLTGTNYMSSYSSSAESSATALTWDFMNGWSNSSGVDTNLGCYMFKRAPGFFDVVAYKGNFTTGRQITHNLEVVPELIIVKRRDANGHWGVYHKDLPLDNGEQNQTQAVFLNFDVSSGGYGFLAGHNYQTATHFTTWYSSEGDWNISNADYISYLFATLPGISKIGSYSGTGNTINVDCDFTAGARFILIKRTDSTGDWYVWDTFRGIVSGNDPYWLANTTDNPVTNTDYIDPLSTGFTVTASAPAALNASGGTYIFLAIA